MTAVDDTSVIDLDHAKNKRLFEEMDDVTLVYVVLGLQGEMEGVPTWGRNARTRQMLRQAFTEIATRWIPPDVFGAAFEMLMGDDEDAS